MGFAVLLGAPLKCHTGHFIPLICFSRFKLLIAEKFSILKENIESYTSFICQNYKQQIGETPKGLKATTDEEFITLVEKFTKEFLIVMKDWSL